MQKLFQPKCIMQKLLNSFFHYSLQFINSSMFRRLINNIITGTNTYNFKGNHFPKRLLSYKLILISVFKIIRFFNFSISIVF